MSRERQFLNPTLTGMEDGGERVENNKTKGAEFLYHYINPG